MTRIRRSGMAVLWALIVLTVLGGMTAAAAWQVTTARRVLLDRQHRLQAVWLARSAAELAAARLLADPDKYAGEEVAPVADAKVTVTVKMDPAKADIFTIRCEAVYPKDGPGSMRHTLTRTATRRTDGGTARIELTAPDDEPAPAVK